LKKKGVVEHKADSLKGEATRFLKNIELVFMAPCVASDKDVRFKAVLSRSIKEIMPYLNAIIKNATYNPDTDTLFFTQGVRMITLTEKGLAVLRAADLTDAHKIMDFVKNKVNEAYDNKDKITPVYEKIVRATALDIYNYLPKTNCGKCGEPNCLAFAVKLLLGEIRLAMCIPLAAREEFKGRKEEMEELVKAMGLRL
jgi:ArsR family metal-binding transcriptional regulator